MANFKMGAIPTDSSLLLSYKMEAGISDQSYGLFIAKMAGIPREILESAEKMVQKMKEDGREIEKALQDVDVNQLTPIQAMLCLSELKEIAQKRGEEEREQLIHGNQFVKIPSQELKRLRIDAYPYLM